MCRVINNKYQSITNYIGTLDFSVFFFFIVCDREDLDQHFGDQDGRWPGLSVDKIFKSQDQ